MSAADFDAYLSEEDELDRLANAFSAATGARTVVAEVERSPTDTKRFIGRMFSEQGRSVAATIFTHDHGTRAEALSELRAILRADTEAALDAERDAIIARIDEASVTWGALTRSQQDLVAAFADYLAGVIRGRRAP